MMTNREFTGILDGKPVWCGIYADGEGNALYEGSPEFDPTQLANYQLLLEAWVCLKWGITHAQLKAGMTPHSDPTPGVVTHLK